MSNYYLDESFIMSNTDNTNDETLPLSPDCVQRKISEGTSV